MGGGVLNLRAKAKAPKWISRGLHALKLDITDNDVLVKHFSDGLVLPQIPQLAAIYAIHLSRNFVPAASRWSPSAPNPSPTKRDAWGLQTQRRRWLGVSRCVRLSLAATSKRKSKHSPNSGSLTPRAIDLSIR